VRIFLRAHFSFFAGHLLRFVALLGGVVDDFGLRGCRLAIGTSYYGFLQLLLVGQTLVFIQQMDDSAIRKAVLF
jgi:hypothetical protein